jgi:hypothetical protein
MENTDNKKNQQGGWARSPSTLVQLAVSSLPPIDPKFFNVIDGVVDKSAPVAANDMVPSLLGQVGKTVEKFFTGGQMNDATEDPYKAKYLKYKAKYLKLKGGMKGGCMGCGLMTGGDCGCGK